MSANTDPTNKTDNTQSDQSYIVGIGASAGGLEALQKFLSAIPPNTGFPYIIVQHLSPDYKSLLGEILGKYTEMPVIQVEDGMEVKPDCVYVIQPGKNMRISKGRLMLSAQKEKELNLPIDMFFRSLAEEAGPRAIAIILSGTGSDGSNGIKDIKERDGMILVQDIESSKFDGMPRSAMRTGLADAQISPEAMALELQHISNAVYRTPELKTERQVDEELMKKIYIILKKGSNINFTHYKQTTILRRIERRMMLAHKETLAEYVDYLRASPEEVKTLSKEVLIGVTSFFRDPDYFQCLKDKAVHDILIRSAPEEHIRVWVAGCSTGEEAYSIAIMFSEAMESLKLKRVVKIFATDLDAEAIQTAGKGVFGDNIIDAVSPARLSRYFSRRNNTYVINRDIRRMIVFSPHNVFQDPPFGRLDLISCRNMLIYFQPVLQNDLFSIFHSALKNGGYLFLGKSEAIGAFADAFPVVDAAAKIFTHRSDVNIPGQKSIPFLQSAYLDDELFGESEGRSVRTAVSAELPENAQDSIDTELLEEFMPACLVVNDKNDLVHIYGENGNYVHLPVGRFTNNLFELMTEGLKIPVSTLLKEAREKKCKVQYKDICFKGEREEAVINLTAMPVTKPAREQAGLYALIFSQKSQRGELPDAVSYDIDVVSSQRITDLEQELSEVQGRLDRSLAEQECVNEELQAANEELLTANEELQSSNEELQSVNEELYTVNSEYQQKLAELADLNDDIANFLSSTLTGIIFVDNKLNIRRYTDYVTTEFSVMDHDIGRSLKFISYHFPSVDITEICDNVLKTLVPDEREITTSKNKVFFMRVAPYRSTENKILGCVITLMDITTQKQGQVQLASTKRKLSIVQDAVEAKSDYLSRITHELRTPMGELVGLFNETRGQMGGDAALEQNLDRMAATIDNMASIVSDISDASMLEREAAGQLAAPFGLLEVIDHASSLVSNDAKEAGLSLEVLLADGFAPLYSGNRAALQQILVCYLGGAIKHSRRGDTLTLRAFEDRHSVEPAGKVRLCFVISGGSPQDAPKPGAGEDEAVDTGVELSAAKELIASMKGSVSAGGADGHGDAVTIRVQLDRHAGNGAAGAQPKAELSGCNVLVAEDNAMNRKILCAILNKAGMTYTEAADGEETVRAFIEAPAGTFDCILMDMRMPRLDGIRAAALIRGSKKADAVTIPIVGVSANGYAEDVKKAREAGIDGYTMKPIDPDALFLAMRSSMRRGGD